MLVKSSKTHEAFFSFYGNEVIGNINKGHGDVVSYFQLKEINRQLADENSHLRAQLSSNYVAPDSSRKISIDSTITDTSGKYRKYTFLPARVVGNSFTLQNNFLTLERGSSQGV